MNQRNSLKVLLTGFLTALALTVGAVTAPVEAVTHPLNHWEEYFTDVSQVVYVEGSVVLDDVSKTQVYEFVSDLENDPLWYPGTLSSQLISGDGGAGTVYQEVVAFGPEPITITATVLAAQPEHYFAFTSDSFLVNVTEYKVQTNPHGKTELTLKSYVQLPPGFTQEALVGYLQLVLNTLPTAMGTTGTVTVQ